MNTKKTFFIGTVAIVLLSILYISNFSNIKNTEKQEYLQIITLNYRNGKDDVGGINLDLYEYSISDKKLNEIVELPIDPVYPVAYFDKKRNKVFFSDDKYNNGYDNLFEYDLSSKEIKQITFGKNEFNDMFVVNDKMYLTVAPQYYTVTKPAIFDMDTYEITYLDPHDTDTWYSSFSYHDTTQKLLTVTNSDEEMRTYEVVAKTHIRPKNIIIMDPYFKNAETIFHTKNFEICLTRQLDESHILMTYDKMMNSPDPRKLKILDIKTGTIVDYDIPGIYEVYSFYPRKNKSGLFILGKNEEKIFNLYYYNLHNQTLERVFKEGDLPSSHRSIVDFVYSIY